MVDKKAGRFSPEMPIKYVRLRFVYNGPSADVPIYGEWMDLIDVYRATMFAHPDHVVKWIEFEGKEAH